ncbi:MAG: hypothetical protein KGL04_07415 [Elusimicrobia bacterium]|nr:hypothetical protein [Elusimicrobiota bacterium]MDE2313986.1 hypothetical protein [Elusimicrobiota bacterium]
MKSAKQAVSILLGAGIVLFSPGLACYQALAGVGEVGAESGGSYGLESGAEMPALAAPLAGPETLNFSGLDQTGNFGNAAALPEQGSDALPAAVRPEATAPVRGETKKAAPAAGNGAPAESVQGDASRALSERLINSGRAERRAALGRKIKGAFAAVKALAAGVKEIVLSRRKGISAQDEAGRQMFDAAGKSEGTMPVAPGVFGSLSGHLRASGLDAAAAPGPVRSQETVAPSVPETPSNVSPLSGEDLVRAFLQAPRTKIASGDLPAPAARYYAAQQQQAVMTPIHVEISALKAALPGQTFYAVETAYPGAGEASWRLFEESGKAFADVSQDEDGGVNFIPLGAAAVPQRQRGSALMENILALAVGAPALHAAFTAFGLTSAHPALRIGAAVGGAVLVGVIGGAVGKSIGMKRGQKWGGVLGPGMGLLAGLVLGIAAGAVVGAILGAVL